MHHRVLKTPHTYFVKKMTPNQILLGVAQYYLTVIDEAHLLRSSAYIYIPSSLSLEK